MLMAGQVKEDADRLKKSGEEKRAGSRATVPMQKDYNKIMLDLVKHQLTDKRNKAASCERVCTSQKDEWLGLGHRGT